MNIQMMAGVLLPFLGTTLGAAMVFFLKDSISNTLQRILTGFAAGVMVALLSGVCFSLPWKNPRIWGICPFCRRRQGS